MKTLIPLFAALLLSLPLPVQAAGADIQFVSEVESVQPGVPFTVALHILPDKHYHTYWKYPGIVGLPTSVKWRLPEGFHAGEIAWPTPEVVDMAGHPAHGFRRELFLPVVITPPKKLLGNSLTLTGELAWMACHKECHPGFATRSLTLRVNRARETMPHPRWAAAIARERNALARKTDLWKVSRGDPGATCKRFLGESRRGLLLQRRRSDHLRTRPEGHPPTGRQLSHYWNPLRVQPEGQNYPPRYAGGLNGVVRRKTTGGLPGRAFLPREIGPRWICRTAGVTFLSVPGRDPVFSLVPA